MSNTDPWFDLNNPSIAAASGAYVGGMTINGMTTMLPPPVTVQRVPPEAFFRGMLDPCARAGHKHSLVVDRATGAVTVTHEDPTAPKGSGAMEMFDSPLHNRDAGNALLGFLKRMHDGGISGIRDIGWRRERRSYTEPTYVEAARDAREPLSAADLMVGPDDL